MIDPKHLENVRVVEDKEKIGTVISKEILTVDEDTVFPLQAALGYDLTQTLFVGPHNLLVEGPSDLLYLQVVSSKLEAEGKTFLDPRWTIVPIGGADKVHTFASLLGAQELNIVAILDVKPEDKQKIDNLKEHKFLKNGNLILLSEYTGTDFADIEDMIGKDNYINLINTVYPDINLKESDLKGKDPRIVKQIGDHFKKQKINNGRLNHYKPASYLNSNSDRIDKIFSDKSYVEKFEKIVQEINSKLQ